MWLESQLQPSSRSMQPDREREPRDPENLSPLSCVETVPRDESEHLTIPLAERRERGESRIPIRQSYRGIQRALVRGSTDASRERVPSRLAPELARDHLARHAEEPCPRLVRNVFDTPPRDEEGLRRDVLRAFRIDPQCCEPQHCAEVLAVDPLEPLPVIRHH